MSRPNQTTKRRQPAAVAPPEPKLTPTERITRLQAEIARCEGEIAQCSHDWGPVQQATETVFEEETLPEWATNAAYGGVVVRSIPTQRTVWVRSCPKCGKQERTGKLRAVTVRQLPDFGD